MKRRNLFKLLFSSGFLAKLITPAIAGEASAAGTARSFICPDRIDPIHSLDQWNKRPRFPVGEDELPEWRELFAARHEGLDLLIRYHGGRDPGANRRIRPDYLFRQMLDGPVYLSAWCQQQQAHRIFRLDRMEIPKITEPAQIP